MSGGDLSYDDDIEGLTETEIACGCRWSLLDWDGQEPDLRRDKAASVRKVISEEEAIRSDRLSKGAKLIAGLNGATQIQRRLIYQLMLENSEDAINRYLKKEGVPAIYQPLVTLDDCIETLIRGIFYKVCRMRRSADLDREIKALNNSLRENSQHLIAYERVGLIQHFIHRKVEKAFGNQSSLPVHHMRNLLSVARLHLSLHDLVSKDEAHALLLDDLSSARAAIEYFTPTETILPEGKTYYPRWRVRHLRPLSYFYQQFWRQRILDIKKLDLCMDPQRYAELALNIYATK